MELILFSTEGCHLCENALSMYQGLAKKTPLLVKEIAFDDVLFSRYAVSIPVLAIQGNSQEKKLSFLDELFWPFELEQLQDWLIKHGIN